MFKLMVGINGVFNCTGSMLAHRLSITNPQDYGLYSLQTQTGVGKNQRAWFTPLSPSLRTADQCNQLNYSVAELSVGWVDPWVGLGWVEIFQFLVGWVHYSKSTKNLKGLR